MLFASRRRTGIPLLVLKEHADTIYFCRDKEAPMACKPEVLRNVPLFALLDDDEIAVLASQVELLSFA